MIELQSLLKEAVDKMASDIFISVGVPPTLKINGQLIKVDDEKLNPETAKKMISELFKTEEDFLDFVKAGGKKIFSTSLAGIGRFRVAAYIQRGSMAAAIRVLRFESLDLGQLNIPTEILDFHSKKKGLILVTGPTGSGKSTTLSAIISLINKKDHAIFLR
jgi:Tfp pilus assembly protein, pilus retraction ATPase PilT